MNMIILISTTGDFSEQNKFSLVSQLDKLRFSQKQSYKHESSVKFSYANWQIFSMVPIQKINYKVLHKLGLITKSFSFNGLMTKIMMTP